MTRRGKHEGTIRKRDDDRWEARYKGADGRRRSVYGKTRREAQERLRLALVGADTGIKPVDGRLTTSAYLDDWLEAAGQRLRASTRANYATIIELYLKPELGRIPLAKLAPEHVQRMLTRIGTRPGAGGRGQLSPTTVRYVYTVLRVALGRAAKSGLVVRNVATFVDPPRKARHELQPLSADQVAHLLEGTRDDRLGALYVTAVGLGLRQGELLGLCWEDVDLEKALLSVRHSLQRIEGKLDLFEPKTERSRRTLILPRVVASALREHRRRQLEERLRNPGPAWGSGFVFATDRGMPLDARNLNRSFSATLARLGLPSQRFHDLRHACATLLIEQGVDITVVSRILGHANLATTADVYAHLTRGMQQGAADQMDAILTRSASA